MGEYEVLRSFQSRCTSYYQTMMAQAFGGGEKLYVLRKHFEKLRGKGKWVAELLKRRVSTREL